MKRKLPILRDGDIIGFSGSYVTSDLINLTTYGIPRYSLSHVGLLARKNHRSKWLVFEANEEVPWQCAVTHRKHDGIQAHSLELLLDRYNGKMWYYERILDYDSYISNYALGHTDSVYPVLVKELGTPYDWQGAKRSGGLIYSALQGLFRGEDTSSYFCSEFVATVLRELSLFDTDNVSMWSPNRLMRQLVRKGTYRQAVRIK